MESFWAGFEKRASDFREEFPEWGAVYDGIEVPHKKKEVRVTPREISEDHGPDAYYP